jgi:hypothetical protein
MSALGKLIAENMGTLYRTFDFVQYPRILAFLKRLEEIEGKLGPSYIVSSRGTISKEVYSLCSSVLSPPDDTAGRLAINLPIMDQFKELMRMPPKFVYAICGILEKIAEHHNLKECVDFVFDESGQTSLYPNPVLWSQRTCFYERVKQFNDYRKRYYLSPMPFPQRLLSMQLFKWARIPARAYGFITKLKRRKLLCLSELLRILLSRLFEDLTESSCSSQTRGILCKVFGEQQLKQ